MNRLSILMFVALPVVGCSSQPVGETVLEETVSIVQDSSWVVTYSIDELLGKIEPSSHSGFSEIPLSSASKSGMWLRSEALVSFNKMQAAAANEGVSLKIVSATRTFSHQKRIWQAKWNGSRKVGGKDLSRLIPNPSERARKILEFSSMPGTSRHHWGTDIDINSVSPNYFESGRGKREYEWLRDHAFEFGFCQTYTEKGGDRPHGYEMEKWHWTYVPVASQMLDAYEQMITAEQFGGFDGDDALPFTEVMNYIHGIAPECK